MSSSMRVFTQAAPLRQQTIVKLREAIIEGRFQRGERLYEQKLCDLTGVSRTVIREALRQLEAEGLVCLIPNKGPVVAEVTAKDAEDIYQVRELLEGLAASLFAQRADASMIEALEGAVQRVEQCLQLQDSRELLKSKNLFYDVLLMGCGNKVVSVLLNSLLVRVTFLRAASLSQSERPFQSLAEIKRILAAIKDRDPEAARKASTEHIRNAAAAALLRLNQEPQQSKPKSEGGES